MAGLPGIAFTPDSPFFQREVSEAADAAQALGSFVSDLSRSAKNFIKQVNASRRAAQSLADRMKAAHTLRVKASTGAGGRARLDGAAGEVDDSPTAGLLQIEPVLSRFAGVLDEICQAQEILAESLETTFMKPLDAYLREDVAQVGELRRAMHSALDAHDHALQRHLHPSQSSAFASASHAFERRRQAVKGRKKSDVAESAAATAQRRAVDVRDTLRVAELARFNLTYKLNELEARKTFELSESVAASFNSFRAFFHMCLDTINANKPFMDELNTSQQMMRQQFQTNKVPWDVRRQQLHGVLTTSLAPTPVAAPASHCVGGNVEAGGGHHDEPDRVEAETAAHVYSQGESVEEIQQWLLQAQSRLQALYAPRARPEVVREGWLYRRETSRMKQVHWHRRWFVLTPTTLQFIRSSDDLVSEPVCDVLLATVRDQHGHGAEGGSGNGGSEGGSGSAGGNMSHTGSTAGSGGGGGGVADRSATAIPHCFEIFSATRRSEMLQAASAEDHQLWTAAIRSCIARQLASDGGAAGGNGVPTAPSSGGAGSANLVGAATSVLRELATATLQADGNDKCADCGADSPTWVSINLVTVLCIECSGIHRSLGSHISKVRSVTLDALPAETLEILSSVGNTSANRIWEHTLQKGWNKPQPHDDRAAKEQWIRSKYHWRGFARFEANLPEEQREVQASLRLHRAAGEGDLVNALEAVSMGASLSWVNPDPLANGRTALHEAARHGHGAMCELLLLNGADLNAMDGQQLTPLELAMLGNHTGVVSAMAAKLEC